MNKGQTKTGSLVEALTNIIVGCTVAYWSQVLIFHLYGIPVNYWQNLQMTAWFTAVSLVRSFSLRRFFNWITTRHFDGWVNIARDGRPTR